MRMRTAFRFLREMAARHVAAANLIQRWVFLEATLPRVRTAIVKATAFWPRGWGRHSARNCHQSLVFASHTWHRAEEAFRVRMMRAREEIGRRRFLHHFARVHH